MKQVLIDSPNKNKNLLRKTLLANKYPKPVLIRLGNYPNKSFYEYTIQINSERAVLNTVDKLRMKRTFSENGLPSIGYYTSMDYIFFPCIFKGRFKSKNRPSVYYIDSKADFSIARSLSGGGYYYEHIFKQTSEYRLYCTQAEVFFVVKKIKLNNEDIIVSKQNSYNLQVVKDGNIHFPKLWNTIQKTALSAMRYLGLDIASVDIGYSSEGAHSFVIHKVNANPPLPANVLPVFAEQLDLLIKKKL